MRERWDNCELLIPNLTRGKCPYYPVCATHKIACRFLPPLSASWTPNHSPKLSQWCGSQKTAPGKEAVSCWVADRTAMCFSPEARLRRDSSPERKHIKAFAGLSGECPHSEVIWRCGGNRRGLISQCSSIFFSTLWMCLQGTQMSRWKGKKNFHFIILMLSFYNINCNFHFSFIMPQSQFQVREGD